MTIETTGLARSIHTRLVAHAKELGVDPNLRAYRAETAIAEKVHAMVVLGSKNSRMRDFFDVYTLAEHASFEGRTLSDAIRTTFARRRTPIPQGVPLALTSEFADSREKETQWTPTW